MESRQETSLTGTCYQQVTRRMGAVSMGSRRHTVVAPGQSLPASGGSEQQRRGCWEIEFGAGVATVLHIFTLRRCGGGSGQRSTDDHSNAKGD